MILYKYESGLGPVAFVESEIKSCIISIEMNL